MKKIYILGTALLISVNSLLAQTWTPVNSDLPVLTARGLAKLGDTLFVGLLDGGYFYTVDNGNSWNFPPATGGASNNGLNKFYGANAGGMGNDVYFFILAQSIVQYYEQGNGFYNIPENILSLPNQVMLSYEKAENPQRTFIGTAQGLYYFDDINTGIAASGISTDTHAVYTILEDDNDIVLAGTNYGLYSSTDNGSTFSLDATSIPAGTSVHELGLFTLTSNGVYFYNQSASAFIPLVTSGDYYTSYWDMGGTGDAYLFGDNVGTKLNSNFEPSNIAMDGITGGKVNGVAVIGNYLFVSTDNGGVFRSDLGGSPISPAAPTNLVATVFKTQSNYVELSWNDNSNNEDGFGIERSTDGQNYTSIDSVSTNVITFQDNALAPLTTYYYRVFAFNNSGNSSNSNEVQVTTDASVGISSKTKPNHISVLPNPSNGNFTVSGLANGNYTIQVLDIAGKTVQSIAGSISGTNLKVELNNSLEGIYFVKVSNAHGFIETIKIAVGK